MMKNKECNVIRDLLPNYMGNLTSNSTNTYIENHIKECSECRDVLKNMQIDYNVKKEDKKSKCFVDFARKYNRKFKFWKFFTIFIILLAIIIFVFSTTRKCVILLSNNEKLNNTIDANNYYYRVDMYAKDDIHSQEVYKKDGKYVYISSFYNKNTYEAICPAGFAIYYDGKNTYEYKEDEKTKTKYYNTYEGNVYGNILMEKQEIKTPDILLKSIFSRIDTTNINGKRCYRIIPSTILINSNLADNNINYIEKDTGFPLRSISTNTLSDYTGMFEFSIELNTVTDDDLAIPNAKDYKPYEDVKEIIEQNAMN